MLQTKRVEDWEIFVPKDIAVLEDKKTKAKSVAFPIEFPDGYHGFAVIIKNWKSPWVPSEDIETITIKFRNDD